MNDAEIKLELIRLIDSQQGEILRDWYQLLQSKLQKNTTKAKLIALEAGYKAMSEDTEREALAFKQIEGTLNADDL